MGLFDRADTASVLEDLLDREREAMLAGRFDVLERLMQEKQRLIGRVKRDDTARTVLQRLQRKAERNHGLLEAMKSGIASARERVAGLRDRPAAFRTYDASGRQNHLDAPVTRLGHCV